MTLPDTEPDEALDNIRQAYAAVSYAFAPGYWSRSSTDDIARVFDTVTPFLVGASAFLYHIFPY